MGITHHDGLDVAGTTIVSGVFRVQNANVAGLKTIAAGSSGSGIVSTTAVRSTSRILLTPIGTPKATCAVVATIASGSNFKVLLHRMQTAGTVVPASGRVAWFIVNP